MNIFSLSSLSREPWASDLSWHHYLCTTKDGFVLVPNRTKGIVMKVRISTGKQLKRFIHPAMRGPRQVTIDENDNIYVACFDSRCVLLLTKLGIWRQVVSSEELPRNLHPHAVCVYQSKMYVAGKGDNGNICVFSLPYFMYHQWLLDSRWLILLRHSHQTTGVSRISENKYSTLIFLSHNIGFSCIYVSLCGNTLMSSTLPYWLKLFAKILTLICFHTMKCLSPLA